MSKSSSASCARNSPTLQKTATSWRLSERIPFSAAQARSLVAGARHVFGVTAAVFVNTLRRQFEHAIGQRGQEVPVMRDEQHGALEFGQSGDEHLLGRHVE